MNDYLNDYLMVIAIVFSFYMVQFITGQYKGNNAIVDVCWGWGFVIAIWSSAFLRRPIYMTAWILVILVSLWGVRLSFHIYRRNHGKPEDFRYQNFRRVWGTRYVRLKAFVQVYMLQMLMLLMISSAPIATVIQNPKDLSVSVYVGVLVWLIGYYFEVRSDYMLAKFKRNPNNKGKILKTGLYKYTRHPNYFGEAVMWWGIYLICYRTTGPYFLISPITITFLLRYVSGVPMLEKHYENNEAYQDYASKTPIFIPWLPKK